MDSMTSGISGSELPVTQSAQEDPRRPPMTPCHNRDTALVCGAVSSRSMASWCSRSFCQRPAVIGPWAREPTVVNRELHAAAPALLDQSLRLAHKLNSSDPLKKTAPGHRRGCPGRQLPPFYHQDAAPWFSSANQEPFTRDATGCAAGAPVRLGGCPPRPHRPHRRGR